MKNYNLFIALMAKLLSYTNWNDFKTNQWRDTTHLADSAHLGEQNSAHFYDFMDGLGDHKALFQELLKKHRNLRYEQAIHSARMEDDWKTQADLKERMNDPIGEDVRISFDVRTVIDALIDLCNCVPR